MLTKLKSKFQSEEKKRLLSNFLSLTALQGLNYILPLITLPYLVRVLGVENFGLISFATATIMYFNIFTDYGFSLTATKYIAKNRENKKKIIEIFSAVMTIKIILMFISLLLISLLIFFFDSFSNDPKIYFLTFGMIIGQVIFPVWFFQGMEKMKYIAYLNILAKSLFTGAIFIFVTDQNDYYIVPILNSLGFIIAGIISLVIIKKEFKVSYKYQSVTILTDYLKDGWHVFVSNIAIGIRPISAIFILGLFANNTVVGYYSAAEKIIFAIKGMMGPIFQTVYPYIITKVKNSKSEAITFIKKISVFIILFTGMISLSVYFFTDELVNFLLGSQYNESIAILKILSFLPIITGTGNIFGMLLMLPFDKQKAYSNILLFVSILNIILLLISIPIYNEIGAAYINFIVECLVTISMFVYLVRKDLFMIRKIRN